MFIQVASLWKAAPSGFQQSCGQGPEKRVFSPCRAAALIPWFPKAKETSQTVSSTGRSLRPFPAVELPTLLLGDSQGTLAVRERAAT